MICKATLEQQSNQIERLFLTGKLPARITGGTVTNLAVRFDVELMPGTTERQFQSFAAGLALALGWSSLELGRDSGGWYIRRDIADTRLSVSNLLSQCSAPPPPLTAVLGIDDEGAPLLVRLAAVNVRSLCIVGQSGRGLLRAIMQSLMITNSPDDLKLAGWKSESHQWNGRGVDALAQEVERRQSAGLGDSPLIVAAVNLEKANQATVAYLLKHGPRVGVYLLGWASSLVAGFGASAVETEKGRFVLECGGETFAFTAARGDV